MNLFMMLVRSSKSFSQHNLIVALETLSSEISPTKTLAYMHINIRKRMFGKAVFSCEKPEVT